MNLGESRYGTCMEESRAMSSQGDGEAEERGAERSQKVQGLGAGSSSVRRRWAYWDL